MSASIGCVDLCSLLALLTMPVLPWGWNPLAAGRFLDVSVSVRHLHGGGDKEITRTRGYNVVNYM